MTQDLETNLRKCLDEVDRRTKVLLAMFLLTQFVVTAGVVWLAFLSKTADVRTMLLVSVGVLLLGQAVAFFLTCAILAGMTRKTLKAIELLSRE